MARKKSLVIEILGNNKMGRAVRDAMGSLRRLGAFAAGIGRGIARAFKWAAAGVVAMGGALAYAAKQYAEQQQADVDLAAAIRKRGDAVDEMLPKLQAEAVAIQKETKYGDELVQSLQAQAINMGIASDQATEATKAAMGLAKAYGLQVVSAMRLVTRARVGDTATLKRYGIILDDTLEAEEKYQAILKIGASNYGLVQEEVKTLAGRFAQFKNAMGDVVQAFGGAFVEGVNLEDLFARMSTKAIDLAGTLQAKLQPAFEKFRDILNGLMAGGDDRAKAIGQLKENWQQALNFVGPKIEAWGSAAGAAMWRGFKAGVKGAYGSYHDQKRERLMFKGSPISFTREQLSAMSEQTRYKKFGTTKIPDMPSAVMPHGGQTWLPGSSANTPIYVQEVKPSTLGK